MAEARKIYVPPLVGAASPQQTVHLQQQGYPSPFRTGTSQFATPADVAEEATARANADSAEANARASADSTLQANINSEVSARSSADSTLQTNINNEASARASADSTLQTNINNEASARASGDTAGHFGSLDLSGLPTFDPGGGKVWLKAGDLHVGP